MMMMTVCGVYAGARTLTNLSALNKAIDLPRLLVNDNIPCLPTPQSRLSILFHSLNEEGRKDLYPLSVCARPSVSRGKRVNDIQSILPTTTTTPPFACALTHTPPPYQIKTRFFMCTLYFIAFFQPLLAPLAACTP